MTLVKRSLVGLFLLLTLFLSFMILIVGGGAADSQTFESTTGGITISAKEFAQQFTSKTGRQLSEDNAQNALDFANRLISRHHFTLQATSGSLAVAYRECGFDVKAVNPSGGVAGFYQWSGWGSTINGNRWGQAKEKKLDKQIQMDLMSTELEGAYARVVIKMGSSGDPKQAARDWSQYYEGVAISDSQTKVSAIEEWAEVIYDILKTAQGTFSKDNNTGTSTTAIPAGWGNISQYDGHAYDGSGSYPAGQCTWYVYNRAKQLGIQFDSFMGNGGDWFRKAGFSSSHTPKKHTAVSFVQGLAGSDPTYGHVAFCEEVRSDGSILISEMNVFGVPAMTVSYRVLDKGTASQLWYVDGH